MQLFQLQNFSMISKKSNIILQYFRNLSQSFAMGLIINSNIYDI